jgi:hypothetical protein
MNQVRNMIGAILVLALLFAAARGQRPTRPATKPTKPKAVAPAPKKPLAAPVPSPKELAEAAKQSRDKLIEASKNYRESLDKLLALQKQDEARALDLVARRKQLLELGVIARREVDESEAALTESRKKMADTNQRLDEVDQLVAEVVASEEFTNQAAQLPDTTQRRVLLVRYLGRAGWSLSNDIAKVDAFFSQRFGRPMPVSAFGQTETHNRLGFDHSNALDVAVHPDSAEGLALQGFLRAQGISFIAIRGAIAGSATGAHIHIGLPSRRTVWTP